MTGINFTSAMALGAARLALAGETLDVWIQVPGRTRYCQFAGCDETGETLTLRYWKGGEALYADVAAARVQTSEWTGARCLKAHEAAKKQAGETEGQRIGRQASETPSQLNVRLWLERNAARRSPSGRFAGHQVEPAGRR